MRKKTIVILYILAILLLVLGFVELRLPTIPSQTSLSAPSITAAMIVIFFILLFAAIILGMIAWIGALMKQGKQQQWGWFACTMLFGGLVLWIYLIAVPENSPQLPVSGYGLASQSRLSMQKRGIAICYIIGMIVGIIATIFFVGSLSDNQSAIADYNYHLNLCNGPTATSGMDCDPNNSQQRAATDQIMMVIAGPFMITTSALCMTAWIGTLVNLSRVQAWPWFILTFFFGGILIFIYLIGGPQPAQAQPLPLAQPAGAWPASVPSGMAAPGFQPQIASAMEILQQRYARGEIDSATFQQMRALLGE